MNLYFTFESRDTLESFSLFLTIKTISKLNMEDSVKLEIEVTQFWVISRCCSVDLRKEIYKDFLPTFTAVVLFIKRFVSFPLPSPSLSLPWFS